MSRNTRGMPGSVADWADMVLQEADGLLRLHCDEKDRAWYHHMQDAIVKLRLARETKANA